MITMTLDQVCRATGARLLRGNADTVVNGAATDSRRINPGDLFVALIGTKYDAHDFLPKAIEGGAAALLVDRPLQFNHPVPVLLVSDTLLALQALAAHVRSQFNVPVLGITGSSGKTTTKDITAAVLAGKYQVLKTRGNFNNEIGLPLTLLDFTPGHGAAVLEMGMRGLGEINTLCNIARPTSAIINNIGVAHIGRLGSVANIARAKGELLDHIPARGFAFLPGDNPHARAQARRCKGQVLFFGQDPGYDIFVRDIKPQNSGSVFTVVTKDMTYEMYLPLPGRHNVLNALPAIGAGLLLGLTPEQIAAGLARVNLSGMRMEIIKAHGYTIINDAYNANPDSVAAALETLRDIAGEARKIAVLGDMLELGPTAETSHEQTGALAMELGVELLITVGTLAKHMAEGALEAGGQAGRIIPCAGNDEAMQALQQHLQSGDVVLVKGSRGMLMEEIVNSIAI